VKILQLYSSEEQLVKACQQADPKAQRRLYEKYAPKMLAICTRYVGNEMEAEDVMVDGFMKVFDHVNGFKLEGSFEGWIKRIMVNESLMYLRSKKKEGFQTSYDQVFNEPEPVLLATSLETDDLLKMIDSLPLGYKTVFSLYAIEGYSHAEIAKMLSISEGTSKSQLSRARAILQNMITEKDKYNSIENFEKKDIKNEYLKRQN
jgi:RNA polymerase sigma factor (sigma-70 family)